VRALLSRVVQACVVAGLVTTLSFFLIQLAPGDPFDVGESPGSDPTVVAELRRQFGLDRPLPEQYARYVANALRGDFGYSFARERPVSTAIRDALPNTLLLMGSALVVGFAVGVATGVAQATRRGSRLDRVTRVLALAFHSVPSFCLAALVLVVGARWLGWFPTGGSRSMFGPADPLGQLRDRLWHLALPATTLVLVLTATISRLQRTALLDALPEDYVRTAAAKGLSGRAVVLRHALRNALLPVITLVGLAFPALLGGAVFVERVFRYPGMGMLLIDAVGQRDYMLLTGCVLVGSLMVVAGSLLADLLTLAADPRQRAT